MQSHTKGADGQADSKPNGHPAPLNKWIIINGQALILHNLLFSKKAQQELSGVQKQTLHAAKASTDRNISVTETHAQCLVLLVSSPQHRNTVPSTVQYLPICCPLGRLIWCPSHNISKKRREMRTRKKKKQEREHR